MLFCMSLWIVFSCTVCCLRCLSIFQIWDPRILHSAQKMTSCDWGLPTSIYIPFLLIEKHSTIDTKTYAILHLGVNTIIVRIISTLGLCDVQLFILIWIYWRYVNFLRCCMEFSRISDKTCKWDATLIICWNNLGRRCLSLTVVSDGAYRWLRYPWQGVVPIIGL